MSLKRKDILVVVILFLLFVAASSLLRRYLSEWYVEGAIALALLIGLTTQVEIYRRLQGTVLDNSSTPTANYRQIESLLSLLASLKIHHPLPPMRAAAISPDFATTLVSLIRRHRPGLIVEAGSGVSTLVAAYCLREAGRGRILSLEQDARYARTSMQYLHDHGLADAARIVHAPIRQVALGARSWEWYDTAALGDLASVDMLIVDGPLQQGQPRRLLRYPALPLLLDRLSPDAVVVLDDASREDETAVVRLWLEEFGGFELERIPSEKGTAVLYRRRVE
jgi:predicted O-methyltransferase YrrM